MSTIRKTWIHVHRSPRINRYGVEIGTNAQDPFRPAMWHTSQFRYDPFYSVGTEASWAASAFTHWSNRPAAQNLRTQAAATTVAATAV